MPPGLFVLAGAKLAGPPFPDAAKHTCIPLQGLRAPGRVETAGSLQARLLFAVMFYPGAGVAGTQSPRSFQPFLSGREPWDGDLLPAAGMILRVAGFCWVHYNGKAGCSL